MNYLIDANFGNPYDSSGHWFISDFLTTLYVPFTHINIQMLMLCNMNILLHKKMLTISTSMSMYPYCVKP